MSLPASLAPADPADAVAHVAAAFALVRPTGMSDDHVREWLHVAAQDIAEYPTDIIGRACAAARREISDHRQLVPFIIRECETLLDERRRAMRPRPVHTAPALPDLGPIQTLTHDELQSLNPVLRRIGVNAGYLTEDDDGTVRWTDEESAA